MKSPFEALESLAFRFLDPLLELVDFLFRLPVGVHHLLDLLVLAIELALKGLDPSQRIRRSLLRLGPQCLRQDVLVFDHLHVIRWSRGRARGRGRLGLLLAFGRGRSRRRLRELVVLVSQTRGSLVTGKPNVHDL